MSSGFFIVKRNNEYVKGVLGQEIKLTFIERLKILFSKGIEIQLFGNDVWSKKGAEKVKDFWDDYSLIIGYCAGGIAITAGLMALGKRSSKKAMIAWREAQKQMLDGNRNYDYGPYKLCKFFDPNTLEEIGKVMMHKDTVEAFSKAE